MKAFRTPKSPFKFNVMLCAAVLLVGMPTVHAQSFCASDGQPRPRQFIERFINADCDTCWTDPATPAAGAGVLALDWIVPGSKGDDAPLSPVASRDAQLRLQALGEAVPAASATRTRPVRGFQDSTLRVAHGLPLADYLGASIELKPIPLTARRQRWTSWLALVETLPVGTEGSPIERNLVRNLIKSNWDGDRPLSKKEQNRFFESRSMNIIPAANPNRLRVIGWVEDEKGQVMAAAQSRCAAP
ncbi:hypothetical protein [Polaromonas sp.]|uniref:hypothetical protein n=1 Tax=Polaromonas sp. TaxID=1869339 RepID=UPI0025F23F04|nr:hypothetical protein [Polaromonas sp.]